MEPRDLVNRNRLIYLLKHRLDRGLAEASPFVFEQFDQGNFLLVRFHREVSVPQVFWQVGGENPKNIQKLLHDLISTIDPYTLQRFNEGDELIIKIPRLGLGYITCQAHSPERSWTPGDGSNSAQETRSEEKL